MPVLRPAGPGRHAPGPGARSAAPSVLHPGEPGVSGICGGIGEYFEIDPNIIRVIWVVITAITGFIPGIVAYILLWIILPQHGQVRPAEATRGT